MPQHSVFTSTWPSLGLGPRFIDDDVAIAEDRCAHGISPGLVGSVASIVRISGRCSLPQNSWPSTTKLGTPNRPIASAARLMAATSSRPACACAANAGSSAPACVRTAAMTATSSISSSRRQKCSNTCRGSGGSRSGKCLRKMSPPCPHLGRKNGGRSTGRQFHKREDTSCKRRGLCQHGPSRGQRKFHGPVFHTARWDRAVDLRGKRVAMIGTGASAVQAGPSIAPDIARLLVFQRTPHWLMNNPNYHKEVSAGNKWAIEHIPYSASGCDSSYSGLGPTAFTRRCRWTQTGRCQTTR